ncbi:primase-helicase family protein [Methylocapsa palsarum]|uniref:NrS-1 polymerase-like helicase domain-containing protein n=1 Tax=Methylocapsa palsarum TaxID=1612308 RepID=A0A1I3XR38_9HYPH|nr:primase-helicase family protein [Methylocapsa palsarum]SFK21943.1 hypothetical protein SAMN05444581_10420 [Methylocapsa palsarum]
MTINPDFLDANSCAAPAEPTIALTKFVKDHGSLTKRIALAPDGGLASDSSQCVMGSGFAERLETTVETFGALIESTPRNVAYGLGAPAAGVPDRVPIVSRNRLNGGAAIARIRENFDYRPGEPAFVLLDFDRKDMPADVRARIVALGGFQGALEDVCPGIAAAGRVARSSTSAGVLRAATGEPLSSGGEHVYLHVKDGADATRFLAALQVKCWAAGFGWHGVGLIGQLLERSIIDRSVGGGERLVFEADPELGPGLRQGPRPAVTHSGPPFDTAAIVPSELQRIEAARRIAASALLLEPLRKATQRRAEDQRVAAAVEAGVPEPRARAMAEAWSKGVLYPDVPLDFADPKFGAVTVGDVMAEPSKFEGQALADPQEGVAYGRSTAIVYVRDDGRPWIRSFAHGLTTYVLRYTPPAIEAAMRADPTNAVRVFVGMLRDAELDAIDDERLRNLAKDLSGDGKRGINATVKSAREKADHDKAAWAKKQDARQITAGAAQGADGEGVQLGDFVAYMQSPMCIFKPTGELWPPQRVDQRVPPVQLFDARGRPLIDEDGEKKSLAASSWIARNAPVEQLTWSPGQPQLIKDMLIADGGWIPRRGVSVFNLYRPGRPSPGDATKAGPWLDHVRRVEPNDAEHIFNFLAQRVQQPGVKINHALFLGGSPGIGKDTMLEPVKHAVGSWNFTEITPPNLLNSFNSYCKSVILRISEAKDMGEFDRFSFYEHMKTYAATPPDVLRVNEKHTKEYYVQNVMGVIITSNHKTDGIYLPPDDRRHYVAWSDLEQKDFDEGYWSRMWVWYSSGGFGHVAAWLAERDISRFDPKAPPLKTEAFWAIANTARSPEVSELADVLDRLAVENGGELRVVTREMLVKAVIGDHSLYEWLTSRKNWRTLPYHMEKNGFVPIRNEAAKDGQYVVGGKRQTVYVRTGLGSQEQTDAVVALCR